MAVRPVTRHKATVLQSLVDVRLDDAWALLKTERPERRDGAVYLGGYAIECALKARICLDQRAELLDGKYFTHDLEWLAQKTALWGRILKEEGILDRFKYLVSQWETGMRYQRRHWDQNEVARFLIKAKEFAQWLFEQ